LVKVDPRPSLSLAEIVDIWERVLQQSRIRDDDDFFDLGGDSLQALAVFHEIERLIGKHFPITAIYDASTPRRLAALSQAHAAPPFSPLVLLKPGVGEPLFIAHGIGGHVIELTKLGQSIDSQRPVYAIQAKGVDGNEAPLDKVADMTAYYLAHLRKLQPQGPYYLAGYSFGGIIAVEMARRLKAEGETVALVALIDSFAHPRTFPKTALQIVRLNSVISVFRTRPLGEACAFVLTKLTGGADVLPATMVQGDVAEEGSGGASRRVHAAAFAALIDYRPTRYPGHVEFFRPKTSIFGVPPARVWGKLSDGLKLHAVPGDHRSMVGEHVAHLAAALSRVLHDATSVS
jgi:thioesterase domain-containing protein/acyl carrier protein